jgi:hypothetical protein
MRQPRKRIVVEDGYGVLLEMGLGSTSQQKCLRAETTPEEVCVRGVYRFQARALGPNGRNIITNLTENLAMADLGRHRILDSSSETSSQAKLEIVVILV